MLSLMVSPSPSSVPASQAREGSKEAVYRWER